MLSMVRKKGQRWVLFDESTFETSYLSLSLCKTKWHLFFSVFSWWLSFLRGIFHKSSLTGLYKSSFALFRSIATNMALNCAREQNSVEATTIVTVPNTTRSQ
uniref:Uncharacterized protein n=1 Tax=Arundo donax TaxID=35708 RepID=A0A0A9GIC8_ARUDO